MTTRIAYWNPNVADQTFENVAVERLVKGANIIKAAARRRCPVKTGQLRKSIRVVRKKTPTGRAFSKKKNVRVYAGTFKAYHAHWIEHGTSRIPAQPFLRPALEESIPMIKTLIGAK